MSDDRDASVVIDIKNCARCNQIHIGLEFKIFSVPINDTDGTIWNYWSICPITNEPILMKIEQ